MPSDPRFVHLHLHTDYSLLDGACEIKQLAEEAARRGMPAVAVTDHGNLFAAQNFYHEATSRNVKPIIGCEVYVAKGSRMTVERTRPRAIPMAGAAAMGATGTRARDRGATMPWNPG